MIAYIIVIIIMLILNVIISNRKTFCYCTTLVLILFAGLRANTVGVDTEQYAYLYDELKYLSFNDLWKIRLLDEQHSEMGYLFFSKLMSYIGDYHFFKIISAFCTIAPAGFLIYKYSNNKLISFLTFFMLPIFAQMSMTMMRQGYAFGACLMAVHFMLERNFKAYLFFMIIGTSFHMSLVCVLPIYIINFIEYEKRFNIWIIVLLIIVYFSSGIIFRFLASYSRMQYEEGAAGGLGTLAFFIMLYVVAQKNSDTIFKNPLNNALMFMLIATIMFWFIGMNLAAVFRLAAYTEFFICLFIPNIIGSIEIKAERNTLLFLCLLITYLMMNSIVFRENTLGYNDFLDYKFFWN